MQVIFLSLFAVNLFVASLTISYMAVRQQGPSSVFPRFACVLPPSFVIRARAGLDHLSGNRIKSVLAEDDWNVLCSCVERNEAVFDDLRSTVIENLKHASVDVLQGAPTTGQIVAALLPKLIPLPESRAVAAA